MTEVKFGPTGRLVYERTYSRAKQDGTREEWPDTVQRVVDGNLAQVDERYHLPDEREDLIRLMTDFRIIPAGRHLWASGVKNAQHLFNCWVSHWTEIPSEHFDFTFTRLMEGGGVGSSYSNEHLQHYPPVQHDLYVEIVCDDEHPDYKKLQAAGVLSNAYDPDWGGAFVIEDSREGWASALRDLIDTHYRPHVDHYRRVYDITRVRAEGTKLRTFGGRASGPLPLAQMLLEVCQILSYLAYKGRKLDGIAAMEIDHAIAQCVVAGGVRRSARMAMMHWLDPQIEEFINIKQQTLSHWTTNISVEVDDEFWDALNGKYLPDWESAIGDYTLMERAENVMSSVSEGMVNNGEPGFWDSQFSNEGEPNRVVCTNPCGEITLEPWEPCNLGHVNLAGFITEHNKVDILSLIKAHQLMTRFLIRATFSQVGDPKSREVLDRNRRIGVGHLGVASFLAMMKMRYSEAAKNKWFKGLLRELAKVVDESADSFSHVLRIPVPVKKRTVAPTGTISKMPGVSEGIHPIFSKYFNRRIRFSTVDPAQNATAIEYANQGYKVEPCQYAQNTVVIEIPTMDSLVQEVKDRHGESAEEFVEAADDLTLNEMLSVQAVYQTYWADNAVSFTANVDAGKYQPEDVAEQLRIFGGILKGATIFPESSMPQAPYERLTKEQYEAALVKAISDGVDEECQNGACPVR